MTAQQEEHARAYDAIAVKETINRAAGSRAASSARARERLLAFAPPIFDEVVRELVQGADSAATEEREAARDRMLDLLTDLVCAELRAMRRSVGTTRMPNEQLARYLASTFVLVLDWWRESPVPAREANEYFRSLVLPLLEKEVG